MRELRSISVDSFSESEPQNINFQNFDKPCLLTASELSQSTSYSEIEKLVDDKISLRMLSAMREYELILGSSFNKQSNTGSTNQNTSSRNVLTTNRKDPDSPEKEKKITSYMLRPIRKTASDIKRSRSGFQFIELISLKTTKSDISIIGYYLSHPTVNHQNFNGSLFELCHICCIIQRALDIPMECSFIPIPFSSFIVWNNEKKKLFYSKQTTDLKELAQSMEVLCNQLLDLVDKSVQRFEPVNKIETDIDISPLITAEFHTIKDTWMERARKISNIVGYFTYVIQLMDEESVNPSSC